MANTIRNVEVISGHVVRADQPLAVELVSTLHVRDGVPVDALTTPRELAAWLRVNRSRLDGIATDRIDPAAVLDPLRELRGAVDRLVRAAIAGDPPTSADVERLNTATRRAPAHRELRWPRRDRPRAVDVTPAGPADALLARLAGDAVDVLAGEHGELGACGGPSCVLLFARSRPRQAWCSPACGNRARVARHYRRTKAGS
jgi:predicted RNA-binding Zn ribbon-like protein